MSRKISLSLGVAMLLVLAFVSFAWAQTPAATDTPASPTVVGCPNGNFIDEDGDGVCDNRNADGTGPQYGRGMGHGMMTQGRDYVDADEDGVCDHFADGGMGSHFGRWNRQGMGTGQGMQGQGMRGQGMGRQMMGRGWHQ